MTRFLAENADAWRCRRGSPVRVGRLLGRPATAWLIAAVVVLGDMAAHSRAHAQTLQEAMALAYRNHPALAAQRAQLRALHEDVDRARAGRLPVVSLRTGTGHYEDSHRFREGGGTLHGSRNMSEVRLNASQPVLNWTTDAAIEAAQARERQGHADLLDTEQNVMLEVAKAYLHVLQYRKLLALHDANERSLARQVAYRAEHFQRQLGTRTELAQAQARHAGALAQRDRVRAELASATSAFLRQVGVAPTDLSYPESLPALPDGIDALMDTAMDLAPAVQIAYHGAQAAQADVQLAEGRLKPSVSMDVGGGWTSRPDQNAHSRRDASIQLTLSIPLFHAADRAQLRGDKERALREQSLWRDARLNARHQAMEAWQMLQSARDQIKAFKAAIEANKVAYEGVDAEYAALGELTLIEVLNAQQELFLSEVSLVQARTDAALAHLRLLAAQGRLTARGLGLPVAEQ